MDMGNHRYGTYDSLYIKSKQINKTYGFITYITNSFKWVKAQEKRFKGIEFLSQTLIF